MVRSTNIQEQVQFKNSVSKIRIHDWLHLVDSNIFLSILDFTTGVSATSGGPHFCTLCDFIFLGSFQGFWQTRVIALDGGPPCVLDL